MSSAQAFRSAAQIDAGSIQALLQHGVALSTRRQWEQAVALYQTAILLAPDDVQALTSLAAALTMLRRHQDALPLWERLAQLQPSLDLVLSLGFALIETGRARDALQLLAEVDRLYPNEGRLAQLNGHALLKLNLVEPALGAFYHALSLRPDDPAIQAGLATALLAHGQVKEAAAYARAAFRAAPTTAHAATLSCVLIDQACFQEALAVADHGAAAGNPGFEVLVNRSIALESLGREPEAVQAARHAVSAACTPVTRHHLAALLLLQGQLTEEAWDLYEARLSLRGTRKWPDHAPKWEGQDVRGKTVLLHAEQGFGDTLQFVRYAPLVAARGAKVILAVQPPLKRLLARVPGVSQVVSVGDALPAFDVFSPLLSLPKIFKTTIETIPPALPYADAFEAWTDSAARLRVGLVWAGNPGFINDRHRSVLPADLAVLAGVPGLQFYSLQQHKGLPPALPEELGATDLMLGVNDFADTAALIAGLDLVISVDTAVAHLAATMGKPVWLLSRFRGCWRWLNGRPDSPWYPSLRIIRQQQPNDWGVPLQRIRQDLVELASQTAKRTSSGPRRPNQVTCRPCKACCAPSPAIGIVDFNKSCEDRRQPPMPNSGRPVTYHRCPECALVFTGDFDRWSRDDFRRHIYNEGYAGVDPDYAVVRPTLSASLIASVFGACRGLEMLDYGGGGGSLAALLSQEHGIAASTYDPFNPACDVLPARRFPLVTCFEVLEHTPDPRAAIRAMAGLVQDDGVVLFSTLLQPADFAKHGVNWWYVAPRNGHITIFSAQSLKALWAEAGFDIISYTENLHMAARPAAIARSNHNARSAEIPRRHFDSPRLECAPGGG